MFKSQNGYELGFQSFVCSFGIRFFCIGYLTSASFSKPHLQNGHSLYLAIINLRQLWQRACPQLGSFGKWSYSSYSIKQIGQLKILSIFYLIVNHEIITVKFTHLSVFGSWSHYNRTSSLLTTIFVVFTQAEIFGCTIRIKITLNS